MEREQQQQQQHRGGGGGGGDAPLQELQEQQQQQQPLAPRAPATLAVGVIVRFGLRWFGEEGAAPREEAAAQIRREGEGVGGAGAPPSRAAFSGALCCGAG